MISLPGAERGLAARGLPSPLAAPASRVGPATARLQLALLNLLHGPGTQRKAARGNWPPASSAGGGREKASGLAPRPWVPWACALDPRLSLSAPSLSGRRQSSRPPVQPPPAASWPRRRQRREGEPQPAHCSGTYSPSVWCSGFLTSITLFYLSHEDTCTVY